MRAALQNQGIEQVVVKDADNGISYRRLLG